MLRKDRTRWQKHFDTFLLNLFPECFKKGIFLADLIAEGEQVGVLAPQRAAISLSSTLWAMSQTLK